MTTLSSDAREDLKLLEAATSTGDSVQLEEAQKAIESLLQKGTDKAYFGILKGMFAQAEYSHFTSASQRLVEKMKKQLGLKSSLLSCAGIIPLMEDRNREMTEEEAKTHKEHVARALWSMVEEKQYKAHFQLFTAFSQKARGSSRSLVKTMLDALVSMFQASAGHLVQITQHPS